MKHPYANTYTLLFAIILFGLIILGILSYKNNKTHKESSKLVINSHQVLVQVEHLSSIINTLQINRRGYILTSDSVFVSSFLKIRGTILKYVNTLDKLTETDFRQSANINRLKILISKHSALSLHIADLAKDITRNRDLIRRATFQEIALTNSMQDILLEIQKEENRLLLLRDHFYHENVSSLNYRFFIFLFGAGLFVIGVYFIMKNDLKYRKATEIRIGKLNASLEMRVKEKTQEIIEKEKRYHWILDNMLEGIQIIDFRWKYIYVNEAWAKQSKGTIEQLSGSSLMEQYPGIQNTGLFKVLRECMNNRKSQRLENEFIYSDGSKGFHDLSIQPVPEGLLILSMDISERKKREAEKEQYLKELKEVLFKISHEVRHPVVQILGVSDLLEQELISPDEFNLIMSAMRESALLLDSHTRDLSDFVYTMKNNSQTQTAEI